MINTDIDRANARPVVVLAPFPFFQERGSPIAVDLLLRALSRRGETVHLLTYPEGEDRKLPGLTMHRVLPLPGTAGVGPGFSWKKAALDVSLLAGAFRLVRRIRPRLIHAVEESVFLALPLGRMAGCPVIYDMDSLLSDQLAAGRRYWRPFRRLFAKLENSAMRRAAAVAPMCDALAERARAAGAGHTVVLRDIALFDEHPPPYRPEAGGNCRLVYVGNLEPYQGLELALQALALASRGRHDLLFTVIGGSNEHRDQYRRRAAALGIAGQVIFSGPRPLEELPQVLGAADILVSPRIEGENTPMKIYSYMAAGRAILATDLPTHNQVLDKTCAILTPPDPQALAAGLLRLAADGDLRRRLGLEAARIARESYSPRAFDAAVQALYDPFTEETRS